MSPPPSISSNKKPIPLEPAEDNLPLKPQGYYLGTEQQSLSMELKLLRNALSLKNKNSHPHSKHSKTRLTDLSNPSDIKKTKDEEHN